MKTNKVFKCTQCLKDCDVYTEKDENPEYVCGVCVFQGKFKDLEGKAALEAPRGFVKGSPFRVRQ